ncbi:MAG: patatin-like phospholipase family protein [bacterium]
MKRVLPLTVCLLFIFFLCLWSRSLEAKDDAQLQLLWDSFRVSGIKERPKVALVLSGGGARGLAHAGVLKVLKEEGIPVDMVVGASVGALMGSLYASGIEPEQIEYMAENIRWKKLIAFHLTYRSLYSAKKLEAYIQKHIKNKRFDELEIPFACVAVDLHTGERIIFREGLVAPAVRASASMPGVFDPVEYRHRILIDGGVIDNVPIDIAQIMGADIIIAVVVNADLTKVKPTNIIKIMTQVISIQSNYIADSQLDNADIIIRPKVSNVSFSDLDKGKECVEAGEIATRLAAAKIKSVILDKMFGSIMKQ